jgi:hypothetical protein
MSYKKVFWGVVLIIIGILFIIRNLGWVDFSWWGVFRLWPVLLILWGISVIPIKNYLKLILSFVALLVAVIFLWKYDNNAGCRFGIWNWNHNGVEFNDDEITISGKDQNFTVPFDSLTQKAVLKFEAAAGDFTINSATDKLVEFDKKGNVGNYQLKTEDIDSAKVVSLKLEEGHFRWHHNGNTVNLKLNVVPVWDFDFDIGAANINFDLSPYKTRDVKIGCGASDIKLTIGDKYPSTNIKVDAGASSIHIKIPSKSACQVNTDSFLTSKEFQDMVKTSDHTYQTPGFYKNPNKIYIKVDVGVSSLKIEKY